MTFIKPNKSNTFLRIFISLAIVLLVGGTFLLITLYNRTVDLSHKIADAKAQLDSVGAENTSINNEIVSMLGNTGQLTAIAASDGLVPDMKPQYVSAQ